MRLDYIKRIKRFNKQFINDVLQTCIRIHNKDGKAFPFRIFRSVSKRWKHMHRYKVTLVLNYYEYLGFLKKRLEDVEEFKQRMAKHPGLYERGNRRVYFSPSDDLSASRIGDVVEYRKLSYDELGVEHSHILEYPV